MFRYIMLACLLATLSSASPLFAEDIINAQVVRVYDGDTFFVNIQGVPEVFGKEIGVRIRGVDTPEIRGKCDLEKKLAIKSRDFVSSLLQKNALVLLVNVERDKYFRILATVFVNGKSIADLLLANKLGAPYDGEKKQSWCD